VNLLTDVLMTRDGVSQSRTFQFNAQQRLQSVWVPEMDGAIGTYPQHCRPGTTGLGNLTQIVTGTVTCPAGEITEQFDYSKGGVPTYKRVVVRKSTAQGVLSNSMDWHRGIEASTGRVVNEYYPAVLDDSGNIDLRYPGMNHRVDFGYDAAGRPNLLQWADFVSSTWQAPSSARRRMPGGLTKPRIW
jgi:hypothetical protein